VRRQRRSFYAAKQKVAGGQWKHGGMGNVAWEGVPLRQFLADMKLEPAASVRWLTAEGWDEPPTPEGSDFAKSYDIDDPALDHAIIALKMNGEPIPAIHGGPVRLVIPGFYGNMNVKFLTVLLLAAEQSPSAFQSGQPSDAAPARRAGPVRGQRLYDLQQRADLRAQDQKRDLLALARGQAEGGRGRDHRGRVQRRYGPDHQRRSLGRRRQDLAGGHVRCARKPVAWYCWSAKANLAAGTNQLMARATDALGRTQPMAGESRWWDNGALRPDGMADVDATAVAEARRKAMTPQGLLAYRADRR
jgi:DMSO/TMAO reductase YedYZ molybdopterin-dependent catalytic subunit